MKLTKENLRIGMNYIVISGETNEVKPGDRITVKYTPTTDSNEGSFTVIRWARQGKKEIRYGHGGDWITYLKYLILLNLKLTNNLPQMQ